MNPYLRPTPAAPLSRRTLLARAGLTAVALGSAGGLAACGDDAAPAAAGPAPVTARAADIPVGGGKIFGEAEAVITQPSAGEYKAYSSICTHARCPVSEVTDSINCNCHGSRFSLADGSVLAGPAQSPLPSRAVTVTGDTVSVAV
jgi:nitrite reductase/ring-hydroxylating ferredoxin subunit